MTESQTMAEVRRVRDRLDHEIADMTWDQRREYFAKALREFEERTGTHLQVIEHPGRSARLAKTR